MARGKRPSEIKAQAKRRRERIATQLMGHLLGSAKRWARGRREFKDTTDFADLALEAAEALIKRLDL